MLSRALQRYLKFFTAETSKQDERRSVKFVSLHIRDTDTIIMGCMRIGDTDTIIMGCSRTLGWGGLLAPI